LGTTQYVSDIYFAFLKSRLHYQCKHVNKHRCSLQIATAAIDRVWISSPWHLIWWGIALMVGFMSGILGGDYQLESGDIAAQNQ
jgi:hypothetical protein